MSTHNIGFNEDFTKIIFQLFLDMHHISSSGYNKFPKHYANMSMQYSAILKNCKNDNF